MDLDEQSPVRGRVALAFTATGSAREWVSRHERHEVPGRWPYGLENLGDRLGARLDYLPASSTARRLARILARPRPGPVVLTWDENTAQRARAELVPVELFTGAIWLTDSARAVPGPVLRAVRSARAVWVLSRAQVAPLQALLGPHCTVEFVRFGIDTEFFSERPPVDRPRIVSVGGDRDRDTATLFRALARVQERRPEVDMVVQTSSSAVPPPGIRVVPRLTHLQLRELYATASVVAIATSPNLHVSGMTVSLEAMATGRPVVVTHSPGMGDYVVEGETGMRTPSGDPNALAAALLELLDGGDEARRMGRQAAAVVRERHTSAQLAEQIAQVVLTHTRTLR